ncbi:MAG: DUF2961 domain-containing protein, partial [Bacteroidales bacterium]|nr:DUF2961 domain-containing protein [Bacteroidales bacterium]
MANIYLKYWGLAVIVLLLYGRVQPVMHNMSSGLPEIPVGLDTYRMWDRWPSQRIGVRAYMRSTYDRKGGNPDQYLLFSSADTYNVTLDVKGKGVLYFFRANHWHGSPWRFIVDGKENIVQETGTIDPVNAKVNIKKSEFNPSAPFPEPLNYTWATTKGADLIWTPMPFRESMRIAYSRTRYGTGYYIYHLYADESNLSQPIEKWDITQVPDRDVLDLINRSGTDIAPKDIKSKSGKIKLNKERLMLASIKASPSSVRAFKLTIPMDKALDLERLRLIVTWDEAIYPSIDAPICLFFGAGTFYNRDEKEYLVKAFPMNIRYNYSTREVELACYFPMPFFSSAKFELSGITPDNTEISYEIRYEPLTTPANHNSYFHATYKDIPKPEPGKDMIYLDTDGIEGHKEWSGSFVGTSFIFSHNGDFLTLEGDPRFFFDDSQSPQAYGTGTEEWGGGGGYWGGENMTLPFAGHPCGVGLDKSLAKHQKDLIESAYRFLIADLMPFGRRALITFEHGVDNLSTEYYEAVTYWYGLPSPSLIKTDEFDVGNLLSEKDHSYNSPNASNVEVITSRYELGIDTFPNKKVESVPGYQDLIGKEVYSAHTEDGRFTRGVSVFTLILDPDNKGAILRRTLDYSYPNQTAEVYVSDAKSGQELNNIKWEFAGIWYLAGSNTSLKEYKAGELIRNIEPQTSNRRFRDDEFLIPAKLT